MRIYRVATPALLVSWAFAPVIAVQSDTTGLKIALGGGAGRYEVVERDCEGDVIASRPVEFSTYGAMAEHRASDRWRFVGFGGVTSVSGEPFDTDGAYGGVLVAAEWQRFGLGTGWATFPGSDYANVPTGYVRLGRSDAHVRFELFPPSTAPAVTGFFRGGVGFRQERVSGVVGLGAGRVFDFGDENGGPFADLEIALTPRLDLTFQGSWHLSEEHPDWGVAVGAQYRFPRPPNGPPASSPRP